MCPWGRDPPYREVSRGSVVWSILLKEKTSCCLLNFYTTKQETLRLEGGHCGPVHLGGAELGSHGVNTYSACSSLPEVLLPGSSVESYRECLILNRATKTLAITSDKGHDLQHKKWEVLKPPHTFLLHLQSHHWTISHALTPNLFHPEELWPF